MKRNYDKHTDAATAKANVLKVLKSCHDATQGRGSVSKAGMGYAAYPDYDFARPQGAAFSVAKIARELQKDGLITYDISTFSSYRITQRGLDFLMNVDKLVN